VAVSENPIHALGFSETQFDPFNPGRLCRGRERWIQPWQRENIEEEPLKLARLIISGAEFVDDSARDALRGLPSAGVHTADLVRSLFPDARLVVFTEDGHPADIPDEAQGIELYQGYRAGGRSSFPLVRWYKEVLDHAELDTLLHFDGQNDRCRGLAVVDKKTDLETLWQALFPLVGSSTLDSPPAHYQAAAMPDVLEVAHAILLLHRDKHGPALGVYSRESLELSDRVRAFCSQLERLLVPFAIPPMLARWDRALFEMRGSWETENERPFPVPRAAVPSSWDGRRGRRRRKGDAADELEPEDGQKTPSKQAPPLVEISDDLDAMLSVAEPTPAVAVPPPEDELPSAVDPVPEAEPVPTLEAAPSAPADTEE
jgi:hypothetical protein